MEAILNSDARIFQPPLSMSTVKKASPQHKARSVDTYDRRPIEAALTVEGVRRDTDVVGSNSSPDDRSSSTATFSSPSQTPTKRKTKLEPESDSSSPTSPKRDLNAQPKEHRSSSGTQPWPFDKPKDHGKGHAHDPLSDHLFLQIGPGGNDEIPDPPAVSESPPAADVNIYESAYHDEIERIREKQGRQATLYLTRRVDKKKEYQEDKNMVGIDHESLAQKSGFAKIWDLARKKGQKEEENKGPEKEDRKENME